MPTEKTLLAAPPRPTKGPGGVPAWRTPVRKFRVPWRLVTQASMPECNTYTKSKVGSPVRLGECVGGCFLIGLSKVSNLNILDGRMNRFYSGRGFRR